jgi:hypothetical protein
MIDDLNHPCKKLIPKSLISEVIIESKASVFALLGAGDIGEEIQVLKSKSTVQ